MDGSSTKKKISSLIVNMKLSERCNLNCTYCYYYTEEHPESLSRPPLMRERVSDATIRMLQGATEDYDIENLVFAFHGGEPTLMNPRAFLALCGKINDTLQHRVGKLHLLFQTNGVHLSDAWLDVAKKFNVHVGVSLDGPKEYNDLYRLDHKGNGSYDRIRKNIEKLSELVQSGELGEISIIAVMNPQFDYAKVYKHLVNDLGVRALNFLLPDHSGDSNPFTHQEMARLGDAFCSMFELWLESDQNKVFVKQFSDIFWRLAFVRSGKNTQLPAINVVVHSDGSMTLNDSYMAAATWFRSQQPYNIETTSLRQWLSQPIFSEIEQAHATLPADCSECRHRQICRGGELEHRFRSGSGFNNRSIYCDPLTQLYDHIASVLSEGGYAADIGAN